MNRDKEVKIVITGKDNTGTALTSAGKGLDNLENKSSRLMGSFVTLAKVATTAFAAAGTAGIALGINVAATLQTAEIGLKTLLGSSEEAAQTIERLKIEAKRTPFELPGLARATQLLSSVTKDGNKSVDIILDVGEALAAMGKGQSEMDRIIINLQQVAAIGKAATIDIKQFAFAGIPIYEMLQKETKLTGDALADFIEQGGVTFELLTEMFDKANDEGGQFFNAFVNQSGTFNQALSNMKDSLGIFFADFVTQTGLFQGLTTAMITVSNTLGNYKQIIEDTKLSFDNLMSSIDEKTGIITYLTEAWATVYLQLKEGLFPVLQEFWERHGPFIKEVGKSMAIIFGVTLVAAIKVLSDILAGLILLISAVIIRATAFVDFALNVWNKSIETIAKTWEKVATAIERVINLAKRASETLTGGVSGLIGKVVGARAEGGPVMQGGSYIVGENGPEIFTPSKSGFIIPNGGGGSNVTINITGNTLLDSMAAEQIGNMIISRLKLSNSI